MQVALSAIMLTDLINDTVVSINGTTYNLTANQLVAAYPQTFYKESTSFGEERLCIARIDGQPLSISAVHSNVSYNPDVINYDVIFPGNFSTHPIHRPK